MDSIVKRKQKLTMEVSTFAGLSCDGQERLKEDCLRRIVVEKNEIGGGGGSVSSGSQLEEDSIVRDWGNCSDYEAQDSPLER